MVWIVQWMRDCDAMLEPRVFMGLWLWFLREEDRRKSKDQRHSNGSYMVYK